MKHGYSSKFGQNLGAGAGVALTVTLAGWWASGGGGKSQEAAAVFHLMDVGRTPEPHTQQEQACVSNKP